MNSCKYIHELKDKVYRAIREYFYKTGSIEVFTDILRDFPNLDSNIYPLEVEYTTSDGIRKRGFLHTSPEYEMKILLSEIKTDIFQIAKVFRDFEGSSKHKIEFTMLEWYRTDYSLEDLMEDTKNIFIETALSVKGKTKIIYKNKEFNLCDWDKITVEEAFFKFCNVDIENPKSMYKFLKNSPIEHKNISIEDWEEMFYLIYAFYVEKNLGLEKPTFIYNYPEKLGALSEIKNGKALRFEAYIYGLELVNGYKELTDVNRLKTLLETDARQKKLETGKEYPIDEKFLNSVKNMPKSAGASMGIDRLIMILLNKDNINQI